MLKALIIIMVIIFTASLSIPALGQGLSPSGDYTDTGDEMTGFEEYLATDDDDEDD